MIQEEFCRKAWWRDSRSQWIHKCFITPKTTNICDTVYTRKKFCARQFYPHALSIHFQNICLGLDTLFKKKKKIRQKVYIKTSSKNGQKSRKYNLLNPQKGVMRRYRRRYDHICEIHKKQKNNSLHCISIVNRVSSKWQERDLDLTIRGKDKDFEKLRQIIQGIQEISIPGWVSSGVIVLMLFSSNLSFKKILIFHTVCKSFTLRFTWPTHHFLLHRMHSSCRDHQLEFSALSAMCPCLGQEGYLFH